MATKTGNRQQARKRLPDGTRIAGYGKTEAEANQDLERKLEAIARAAEALEATPLTDELTDAPTFHQVAKSLWYPRIQPLEYKTRAKYTGIYRKHVRGALGEMPIKEVTAAPIQSLINEVAAKPANPKRPDKLYSPSTQATILSIVHQVLECAREAELVQSNKSEFVKVAKKNPKRERVLEPEDALRLLEELEGTDLAAPVFMSLVLGLRQGEAIALKWEGLNRRTRELRVAKQRQAQKGKGVIEKSLKSGAGYRTLRLTARLVDELDKRGNLDSPYICTHDGEPWVNNTISRRWREHKPAWMAGWTFHDLRHGAAGLLSALGCDLLEIMAILGQAHPSMASLYTSLSEQRVERGMANMDALFQKDR